MTAQVRKKTFKFTLLDNTTRVVTGKGRQSACMRLTGKRVKPAIESGLIKSVEQIS